MQSTILKARVHLAKGGTMFAVVPSKDFERYDDSQLHHRALIHEKLGPVFEVHRVEVHPPAAPYEAVLLKHRYNLWWDTV